MTEQGDPNRAFERALGFAKSPQEAFAALHELARATIGVRLFTVMSVDVLERLAHRAYTSDPAHYPVTGTKPIERNAWFEAVVARHETFAANSLQEIADVFPDHALIGSLGCGAVINLPVLRMGSAVATINLLDVEGRYDERAVARAQAKLALASAAAVHLGAALAAEDALPARQEA